MLQNNKNILKAYIYWEKNWHFGNLKIQILSWLFCSIQYQICNNILRIPQSKIYLDLKRNIFISLHFFVVAWKYLLI